MGRKRSTGGGRAELEVAHKDYGDPNSVLHFSGRTTSYVNVYTSRQRQKLPRCIYIHGRRT